MMIVPQKRPIIDDSFHDSEPVPEFVPHFVSRRGREALPPLADPEANEFGRGFGGVIVVLALGLMFSLGLALAWFLGAR